MSSDNLVRDIERYRALRMHQNDKAHLKNLQNLKVWQVATMQETYASMSEDPTLKPLLDFFFGDIYGGFDLSELPEKLKGISMLAQKFFSGTDMLFAAMEFNAVNCEADQRLCETLFEDMQLKTITTEDYVKACHQAGILDDLHRRNQLIELFASDLNKTISNKFIRKTVKWSRIPANAAGFGKMHGLIEKGFEILGAVDDAEKHTALIMAHEVKMLNKIHNKLADPFEPMLID